MKLFCVLHLPFFPLFFSLFFSARAPLSPPEPGVPYITNIRTGKPSIIPETRKIHGNFILATYFSQQAIDTDDGSAYYEVYDNFFVYGDNGLKSGTHAHARARTHTRTHIYDICVCVCIYRCRWHRTRTAPPPTATAPCGQPQHAFPSALT